MHATPQEQRVLLVDEGLRQRRDRVIETEARLDARRQ